jgi:hypothetical protein
MEYILKAIIRRRYIFGKKKETMDSGAFCFSKLQQENVEASVVEDSYR